MQSAKKRKEAQTCAKALEARRFVSDNVARSGIAVNRIWNRLSRLTKPAISAAFLRCPQAVRQKSKLRRSALPSYRHAPAPLCSAPCSRCRPPCYQPSDRQPSARHCAFVRDRLPFASLLRARFTSYPHPRLSVGSCELSAVSCQLPQLTLRSSRRRNAHDTVVPAAPRTRRFLNSLALLFAVSCGL